MKGISCETGDAFFIHRSHQTTIMPAEILFHVISDLIDPATDRKGNVMAKSHYQFAKRQKELAKKKKKEEKRQRKQGNKAVETDETEEDPTQLSSKEVSE
jgi:hypothetical protein|tara:strand:- start:190 stop:489 length:300 start_codon:yes stop_codon:yes gene_type:complete